MYNMSLLLAMWSTAGLMPMQIVPEQMEEWPLNTTDVVGYRD